MWQLQIHAVVYNDTVKVVEPAELWNYQHTIPLAVREMNRDTTQATEQSRKQFTTFKLCFTLGTNFACSSP